MGVDAGATKTQIVVQDARGRILADVMGGPGNFQDIGVRQAEKNIGALCKRALKKAGIQGAALNGLCFGMAGADRAVEDSRIIRKFLDRIAPRKDYLMVVDVRLGLRLGARDGVGIAVMAGTGCNCIGVNQKGQEWAVGGWMTQSAGGGHLGHRAVNAAIEGVDGRGPTTLLTRLICGKYGLKKLEDLLELGYYDRPRKIAISYPELAPLAFLAASKGDRVALALLRQEGHELARMVDAVMRRIFRRTRSVSIVMAGSILQKARPPLVAAALKRSLLAMHGQVHFDYTLPTQAPVFGALAMAWDQASRSDG